MDKYRAVAAVAELEEIRSKIEAVKQEYNTHLYHHATKEEMEALRAAILNRLEARREELLNVWKNT